MRSALRCGAVQLTTVLGTAALRARERPGGNVDKKNLTIAWPYHTRAGAGQIQRRFIVGTHSISPTADRSYLGPKSSHRDVTNLGSDGGRSGSIGNHWQRRVSLNFVVVHRDDSTLIRHRNCDIDRKELSNITVIESQHSGFRYLSRFPA
ncbi:hypothetical protein DEU56DRAFT_768464 [Suillus clintonianus]|uniref:uncharacterized protein n=1 Tax=Suillus clintonianus TaxID=1904413 RepID=UPI001B86897C|nr:uncharacterized protein DEU56DRAFT_768464 [Suillus clintonianus]KAG2155651.1 hypothetical protein DEU56DRAFT_768464 [Suillus clintonianus]